MDKIRMAVTQLLKNEGWDILNGSIEPFDWVAYHPDENGELCFLKLIISDPDKDFESIEIEGDTRIEYERAALKFLTTTTAQVNGHVKLGFYHVEVKPIRSKAMIRIARINVN